MSLVQAEEIHPSPEQVTLLKGQYQMQEGIRIVTGETDDTGHGPITYYHVPFKKGSFSTQWKHDQEQKNLFVIDAQKNGKATHLLKVYVNGMNKKVKAPNTLTIITYDGSTKLKKKATIKKYSYHVEVGKWNSISIQIQDLEASIQINQDIFKVQSERFNEGVTKIGIGHFSDRLYTKNTFIQRD